MNFLIFNSKKLLAVFVVILIIISYLAGFFTNRLLGQSGKTIPNQTLTNSIFASQLATINGKITKIQGRTLSISGEKGDNINIEIGETVSISKSVEGKLSSFTDIKQIELNKAAVISLVGSNGKYAVSSIYYPTILKNVSSEPLRATTSAVQVDTKTSSPAAAPPLRATP